MSQTITQYKNEKRARRHNRIRAKVSGTSEIPRLAVFRSNKFIYAQLIDDQKGITLMQSSDMGQKLKMTKKEKAEKVGAEIAEKAKKAGIEKVVFDRGGYLFKGRVMALAQSARKSGLNF